MLNQVLEDTISITLEIGLKSIFLKSRENVSGFNRVDFRRSKAKSFVCVGLSQRRMLCPGLLPTSESVSLILCPPSYHVQVATDFSEKDLDRFVIGILKRNFCKKFVMHFYSICSGSMIPDTNVGGKIATINEVSDDQKATFFFS